MAFYAKRLPTDVERGARGGPQFKTTIAELSSGHEKRNVDWSLAKCRWNIGYGLETMYNSENPALANSIKTVRDFFHAMRGRAHSFLFKDWSDFTIGRAGYPQVIGTGDGATTTFQLYKSYSASGSNEYQRIITKPVSGTLQVYFDSVLQPSGYTFSTTTGIVTFSPAPADTVEISVICEYDVPVRFDQDTLDLEMVLFDRGSIPNIQIVEVRDT